jgi:hypothetical protein
MIAQRVYVASAVETEKTSSWAKALGNACKALSSRNDGAISRISVLLPLVELEEEQAAEALSRQVAERYGLVSHVQGRDDRGMVVRFSRVGAEEKKRRSWHFWSRP